MASEGNESLRCGGDWTTLFGEWNGRMICEHLLAILLEKSELKPEEGYSADIVRTYIPGDICPHNVRTISHEGYMSHEKDVVRT